MSIKARTGLQPEWYTPISEAADLAPAKFKLRPMTGPEVMDLGIHYHQSKQLFDGQGARQVLGACLMDWSGVTDAEGQPLTFSQDKIDMLPAAVLRALVNRLVVMSLFTEKDQKN